VSAVAHVLIVALLVCGVALEIFCSVGVLAMRSVYARLHYAAPAGLGVLLVAIAILLREGFSLIGDKALLMALLVLVSSPVLSHVTARAAVIREHGDVRAPGPRESGT
jgi:multicomponent Na+:H+ antiporter subunit G